MLIVILYFFVYFLFCFCFFASILHFVRYFDFVSDSDIFNVCLNLS